jgi:hypothetical protein
MHSVTAPTVTAALPWWGRIRSSEAAHPRLACIAGQHGLARLDTVEILTRCGLTSVWAPLGRWATLPLDRAALLVLEWRLNAAAWPARISARWAQLPCGLVTTTPPAELAPSLHGHARTAYVPTPWSDAALTSTVARATGLVSPTTAWRA